MINLAHQKTQILADVEYGFVIEKGADIYKIETSAGIIEAIQAASCIIEPQVGDKVLICSSHVDRSYILAVLRRERSPKFNMRLPGDVIISAPNGSLGIEAKGGVSLKSSTSTTLSSPHLDASFGTARLVFGKMKYFGQVLQATLSRIKTVTSVMESIADRFHQMARASYRTVEESEHFKTGTFHCVVDKLLSLRGKYTVLTAKTDVKINGKHIHMG